MKRILIIFTLILGFKTYAQQVQNYYPKVGDKIIDHAFSDFINFPHKSANISDFKGKWLMLDFWSSGCGTCIASFPSLNKLNAQFADKLQILSVGIYNHGKDPKKSTDRLYIRNLFLARVNRYNFNFACAFDSLAQQKFGLEAVPTILLIDPDGIIRAKTWHLDSLQLSEFIAGKVPDYDYMYSRNEQRSDDHPEIYLPNLDVPLLTKGQDLAVGSDTAFIFRSLITKWAPKMGGPDLFYNFSKKYGDGYLPKYPNKAEAIGMNLADLFQLAYNGTNYWDDVDSLYKVFSRQIVFEVRDSTLFQNNNTKPNGQLFAYSVVLPPGISSEHNFRKFLLDDLHRNFNLQSNIEVRNVPVYNLVVIDSAKVQKHKTKGGKRHLTPYVDKPGYLWTNISFDDLANKFLLTAALKFKGTYYLSRVPPILNNTNLNFNIDLDFSGDNRDWYDTIDILRKNGLDLILGEAKMKTIVIRDAADLKTQIQ